MKKIKAVVVGYGNRGQVYADFSLQEKDKLEIVGIVDPNPFKLNEAKLRYNLNDKDLFKSLEEFLSKNIECDIVINSTMDQQHYETSKLILSHKYNMLVEKPIVPNKEQLLDLEKLAIKNNCKVFVCHVLRYTPFYRTIKQLLLDNTIGKIMTIEMNEHVCLPHYLTSYCRGKWNTEEICGSGFLLAKCCHDMDLISWLNNSSEPIQVASFAHRQEFVKENKPKDATEFCYLCPHEDTCPYSSKRTYLQLNAMPFLTWDRLNKPLDEITMEEKKEFLKHDIYGKCAYDCGDIVDRQNLIIDFKNGSVCSFTLVGGATKADRYIHIVGNLGEIEGKIEENLITIRKFDKTLMMGKSETIDVSKNIVNNAKYGGHSGGDYAIMNDLVNYLNGNKDSISMTSLRDSINGHLIVYAAEKSRKTNKIVKI